MPQFWPSDAKKKKYKRLDLNYYRSNQNKSGLRGPKKGP